MQNFLSRYYRRLMTHPNHWPRTILGIVLIIGGVFGFLPVLGYWMVPLGLAMLAVDWPWARRASRKLIRWWGRQVRAWNLKMQSVAQHRKAARTRDKRNDP